MIKWLAILACIVTVSLGQDNYGSFVFENFAVGFTNSKFAIILADSGNTVVIRTPDHIAIGPGDYVARGQIAATDMFTYFSRSDNPQGYNTLLASLLTAREQGAAISVPLVNLNQMTIVSTNQYYAKWSIPTGSVKEITLPDGSKVQAIRMHGFSVVGAN